VRDEPFVYRIFLDEALEGIGADKCAIASYQVEAEAAFVTSDVLEELESLLRVRGVAQDVPRTTADLRRRLAICVQRQQALMRNRHRLVLDIALDGAHVE